MTRPSQPFMSLLAALVAPIIALSSPAGAVADLAEAEANAIPLRQTSEPSLPGLSGWIARESWRVHLQYNQVRIEQRLIIRISPHRAQRRNLIADWRTVLPREYKEKRIGGCVAANRVLAVQTVSNSDLILYLNDQRIVRARLNKGCNARDYYLGFYVERAADGKLCVDRDVLKARNGATCKIGRMRELVADD